MSAQDIPGVAVVIPCYNGGRLLRRAIDSVLAEPCPGLRVVVVDDGSTDDSLAIARGYGEPVEVVSTANGGACRARNLGLSRVDARYVKFLDADDALEGPILADGVETAERTGADIVAARNLRIDDSGPGRERHIFAGGADPVRIFDGWFYGRCVNTASILWRRSFLEGIGGWDERVAINQDGELFLRALLRGAVLVEGLRGRGVYHRTRQDSISRDVTRAKRENYVETLRRLALEARGTPFERALGGAHRVLYTMARLAFEEGDAELGRKAERALRDIGCDGHFGTRPHRMAAAVLGLEAKSALSRRLSGLGSGRVQTG
jgi:glycosyltransferase involved in cell wall biosynthesis